VKQYRTSVRRIRTSPRQSGGLEAVDQLDGGMVAQQEARCEFPNRRPYAAGQSLQREQSLVLLRLDRVLSSLLFTEMKKQPQVAPELGQRLELT